VIGNQSVSADVLTQLTTPHPTLQVEAETIRVTIRVVAEAEHRVIYDIVAGIRSMVVIGGVPQAYVWLWDYTSLHNLQLQ